MGLQEERGGEGGLRTTMQAQVIPLYSTGKDGALFHYGQLPS